MNKTTSYENIINHLKNKKLIAYPTDTIWGIGCDGTNSEAVNAVFEFKKRDASKPVSLLVADIQMADHYVKIESSVKKLMQLFWPGRVTFVLECKDGKLPSGVVNNNMLGLRCSAHPFTRELMRLYDKPLVTTSLNLSGEPVLESIQQMEHLSDDILIYDTTEVLKNSGSTVVKIQDKTITCLREGAVARDDFKKVVSDLQLDLKVV